MTKCIADATESDTSCVKYRGIELFYQINCKMIDYIIMLKYPDANTAASKMVK